MKIFIIFASIIYLASLVFTAGNFARVNCAIQAWNIAGAIFNIATICITGIGAFLVYNIMRKLHNEIDRLSLENLKFARENEKFSSENKKFSEENKQFKLEVSQMSEENKRLNNYIKQLNKETEKFTTTNENLIGQVNKMTEQLEEQKKINRNLVIIQNQSQELLNSLMSAGDDFNQFGEILKEATNKNLSLTDKLQVIMTGLTEKEFRRLDKNNDGFLTLDELREK